MRQAETSFPRSGQAADPLLFYPDFQISRLVLFLAFLCIPCLPLSAHAGQNNGTPTTLRVGISTQVFSDADPNDVVIAMRLWCRELTHLMSMPYEADASVYSHSDDIARALTRGELTMAVMSSFEYLKIRDKALVKPVMAASHKRYLLLTHCNSGIRSPRDLRGKQIVLPNSKNVVARLWLDVLMLREGGRDRNTFFRRVEEVRNPSQAIMALFFRRVDAVIVSRDAFETSKTLNPQTGAQLSVIAESDYLLGGVTCVNCHISRALTQDIVTAGLTLYKENVGKQILTLFQTEPPVAFSPSLLNGVDALLKERDRLLAQGRKKR